MKPIRIIARLDVKGLNVIKGIQFECLRVIAPPGDLSEKYYLQGIDEIVYIDSVASLYRRPPNFSLICATAERILVPMTVGGGIRTIEDIKNVLAHGADKVAINTAALRTPELIRHAARVFGTQCIVASIAAKQRRPGMWEPYTDNARERTERDLMEWIEEVQRLGAGEILLTSIDQDGMQRGLDLELIKKVAPAVSVPLIVGGGISSVSDFTELIDHERVDGICIASALHYNDLSVSAIKDSIRNNRVTVREIQSQPSRIPHLDTLHHPPVENPNFYTVRQLSNDHIADTHHKPYNAVTPSRKKTISIVDYGINNVESVVKAFRSLGQPIRIIHSAEDIAHTHALVLPGMGAFGDGMEELTKRKLVSPLKEAVSHGIPLLGICLGLQLLFSESEESPHIEGIGLIPGKVEKLIPEFSSGKVPHIGWNRLSPPTGKNTFTSILQEVNPSDFVYFLHSYYPAPNDKSVTLATTSYCGKEFCVSVQHSNMYGTLFHPEKSGEVGLSILKHFCEQVT